MPDDTTDPFEEFKKQKEDKEASDSSTDEEEETEETSSPPETAGETENDENMIEFLKQNSEDDEERPDGYWSHEFDSADMESDDITDVSDDRPGEFTSHRLSPEEQEALNNEAREAANRPEGFESHRMDDGDDEDEEDEENEE